MKVLRRVITMIALLCAALFALAACQDEANSSSADRLQPAEPAATVSSDIGKFSPPTVREPTDDKPVWVVDAVVDESVVAWSRLERERWQTGDWGEENLHMDQILPPTTILAEVGSRLELGTPFVSQLTVIWLEFAESSKFEQTQQLHTSSDDPMLLTEPGLWALDILADFPESPNYPGFGRMRSSFWLQVVEDVASCTSEGGDGTVQASAIVDAHGCPVPGSSTTFLLPSLLGRSCIPAIPMLTWPEHPTSSSIDFIGYRVDHEQIEQPVEFVDLPADAVPTGIQLVSGDVWTSESDAEPVFLQRTDGRVERWLPRYHISPC